MTIRPQVILTRLAHLAFVLGQLERLARLDPSARLDPLHLLAAERALQVAAEVILDVGHHVLAGRGRQVPGAYREVVPALVAEGVFSEALGQALAGMAGMRNLLVHDYAQVDHTRLWAAVDDHLDDLRAAQSALASLPELTARG